MICRVNVITAKSILISVEGITLLGLRKKRSGNAESVKQKECGLNDLWKIRFV